MPFGLFSNGKFSASPVTDIHDQLQEAEAAVDRQIIRTNPTQSGPGEKYGEEIIEDLHETFEPSSKLKSLIKQPETPPVFSYELWFDTETLTINWTLPDEYWSKKFRESITGEYPSIGLERTSNTVAPYNETDYVAGGTVSLRSNRYIPIKALSGPGQFEEDKAPLRMLTSNLAADKTCSVFAQVLFKPAPTNWRSNPAGFRALKADQKARYLKEGRVVWSYPDPRMEDPTEKDLKQANAINAHEDEAGFHVAIRYFVFGDDPDRVEKHVRSSR